MGVETKVLAGLVAWFLLSAVVAWAWSRFKRGLNEPHPPPRLRSHRSDHDEEGTH